MIPSMMIPMMIMLSRFMPTQPLHAVPADKIPTKCRQVFSSSSYLDIYNLIIIIIISYPPKINVLTSSEW